MVNGSELNFSEVGKLDDIKLYGGGKSYDIKPKDFLTYSDSTLRIAPSNLLMKLIGRIYED
jgi:hypothetical protein